MVAGGFGIDLRALAEAGQGYNSNITILEAVSEVSAIGLVNASEQSVDVLSERVLSVDTETNNPEFYNEQVNKACLMPIQGEGSILSIRRYVFSRESLDFTDRVNRGDVILFGEMSPSNLSDIDKVHTLFDDIVTLATYLALRGESTVVMFITHGKIINLLQKRFAQVFHDDGVQVVDMISDVQIDQQALRDARLLVANSIEAAGLEVDAQTTDQGIIEPQLVIVRGEQLARAAL